MSEPAPAGTTVVRTWKDWTIYSCLAILFLLFVFGGPFEQLFLGWVYFPLRVVPRTSIDWPTALLGLICTVAFVAGLHFTLRWFVQKSSPVETPGIWSIRSTVVVAAILVITFAAGTAMVGATHQVIWLMSSRDGHAGDEEARSQRRLGSLLDAVNHARDAARRTQTRNNLKQLGLAFHNFADVYRGNLPPGGVMLSDGTPMHGWVISLSGFSSFYASEWNSSVPWNESPNDRLHKCGLGDVVNICQPGPYFDDEGYGLSHFAGNVHVLPVLTVELDLVMQKTWLDEIRSKSVKLDDITDGTSATLLLGTVKDRFKPWGHPANVRDPALGINRSPDGFGGPPQWKGAMFLMCDGTVKMLNEKIDPKVMQALGTPAGGEKIPLYYDE